MIDIETQKETITKAAKAVTDSTVAAGTKARDYSTATVKGVTDHKLVVRFVELGSSATSSAASVAKDVLEKAQEATGKGVEKVSEWPLGNKNIGEMAQSTVDTVQEKIDVDQIQDQVLKLRDQIEGVLGTWKESFRPTTPSKDADKVVEKSATTTVKTTKKAPPKTEKAAPKKNAASTKAASTKATSTPKAKTARATSAKKAAAAKK